MKSVEQCREILGVTPNTTPDQIKVAYRDLVRVWHPDRFVHDKRLQQKAEEKLKEINEAYEQLQSAFAYGESRQAHASATSEIKPTRRTSVSSSRRSKIPPRSPSSKKAKLNILSWPRLRGAILLLLPLAALTVWLIEPASVPDQGKRLDPAQVKAREDILNTIKETRVGAQRLLVLHQSEVDRLSKLYEERRAQHLKGQISEAELLQTEKALSEAKVRVDEHKRSLAETDVALKEFTARDKSSRSR
jgi:hypothetical protein